MYVWQAVITGVTGVVAGALTTPVTAGIDSLLYVDERIRREGLDVNRLMSDLRDIAFSAGSACASGSGRSSHVLRAMGVSEGEARSSLRLGWGRYTSEVDLRAGLGAIKAAAALQGETA